MTPDQLKEHFLLSIGLITQQAKKCLDAETYLRFCAKLALMADNLLNESDQIVQNKV